MAKIRVVTPTFGRPQELERAIDSVDEQTFKDYVHVIVNDACPKTAAYLKHRAKTDPKMISGQRIVINLTANTNDLGVTPLNEGLKGMTEDYWCVLADDNYWYAHHLECLHEALRRDNDLFDFVWGNTIIKHKTIPEFWQIRSAPTALWNHIDLGEPLYKRELYEKYGPYKYEEYPEAEKYFGKGAADKYSYDWHFIQKCIAGKAKGLHVDFDPSLVWYLDEKWWGTKKYKHDKLRIGFFGAGNGGCFWYRLKFAANCIARNKEAEISFWDKGRNHRWYNDQFMMAHDVLVFQAPSSDELAERIKELRTRGKVCIIEHDDNVFALDWDNSSYSHLGVKEISLTYKEKQKCINDIRIMLDGLKKDGIDSPHLEKRLAEIEGGGYKPEYSFELYKNGHNGFNIQANVERLKKIQDCMRSADAVTCTTPRLAEMFKLFNDNVYVLPNCLDLKNLWRDDLKIVGDGKLRVFWSGGSSHYLDLLPYRKVMLEVMEQHPEVVFVMMGDPAEQYLAGFPKDRIETYDWSEFGEHPYRVHRARPDIGIIPLRKSDFADCKSPIKYLELAALGVPCVVSDSIVYTPVVKDCENGLLFGSPETFKGALTRLITDREMRERLGAAARATAEQYDINKRYGEWLRLYEYLFLQRNFGNPTGNTGYPHILKKWEDAAGQKINTIKQLEAVWNNCNQADALPAEEAAPHGLITLAAR